MAGTQVADRLTAEAGTASGASFCWLPGRTRSSTLCGICCGHFLMPFWEFIGATMAGKALVKARIFLPLHLLGMRAGALPNSQSRCMMHIPVTQACDTYRSNPRSHISLLSWCIPRHQVCGIAPYNALLCIS